MTSSLKFLPPRHQHPAGLSLGREAPSSNAQGSGRDAWSLREREEEKMLENDIPEAVLQGLEEVRQEGGFNMLARNDIIRDMLHRADDGGYPLGLEEAEYRSAISWLVDNESRYMEALNEMGARRTRA
ncbi:hypothetical protein LCGC14_1188910 [marine sediment metagenome]|uniref:Uncharacterized protein n=1 Tax=marine sediment metagenome TaxID=412755 RepID=A0A0F9PQD7_9ZZZZ